MKRNTEFYVHSLENSYLPHVGKVNILQSDVKKNLQFHASYCRSNGFSNVNICRPVS
jgi:hypothetical protein